MFPHGTLAQQQRYDIVFSLITIRVTALKCGQGATDLAKHDFAGAGVDHQLQGCSIHIEHDFAVGDTGDRQPKPQRPVCHLPECLQCSQGTLQTNQVHSDVAGRPLTSS